MITTTTITSRARVGGGGRPARKRTVKIDSNFGLTFIILLLFSVRIPGKNGEFDRDDATTSETNSFETNGFFFFWKSNKSVGPRPQRYRNYVKVRKPDDLIDGTIGHGDQRLFVFLLVLVTYDFPTRKLPDEWSRPFPCFSVCRRQRTTRSKMSGLYSPTDKYVWTTSLRIFILGRNENAR